MRKVHSHTQPRLPALSTCDSDRVVDRTLSEIRAITDRAIVVGIMTRLAQNIEQHWASVQSQQRGRHSFRKLQNYALVWNCFTPGFLDRIHGEMKIDAPPFVCLVVVPALATLSALLLPYSRPDA